jgi:integrase
MLSSWDNRREMVRGNSLQIKMINKVIDDVRFQLKMHYRELQEKEMFVTSQKIKEFYVGKHSLQKGRTLTKLTGYYKKIWEQKIEFKNYKTTIEYLSRFVQWKFSTQDIYLSQLNKQFITDFEYFVRNFPLKDHDPCLGNGVAKHIQRFKRIMNWAVEIEWMKINPFKDYRCPIKKSKRQKLSTQLLVAIELKIFRDELLAYVKDLFLFSGYTGFAFADVMALKENNFEWDTDGTIWCRLYRMKTDELSPVPLLKDAAAISESTDRLLVLKTSRSFLL